jgi:hypothetical protein
LLKTRRIRIDYLDRSQRVALTWCRGDKVKLLSLSRYQGRLKTAEVHRHQFAPFGHCLAPLDSREGWISFVASIESKHRPPE